ncbi:LptF/LptG family permease, partial [bacterium]|nr:LptF/LptG family permease [bacterium]
SKSSEIIAMMAAGVSLFHLVFPVFLIGSLVAGFTYSNQSYLAPMLGSDKRTGFTRSRSEHSVWQFADGKLYHFSEPSIKTKEIRKGLTFFFDQEHQIKQIQSSKGLRLKDKSWQMDEANEIAFSSDEVINNILPLNSIPENKLPFVFKKELSHPKYSSFSEIISEIIIKQQGAINYKSDVFALYQKIAGILSVFTMVLLALPFSLYAGRSVNVRTGIVVSIVMGLVFWLTDQILISLNSTGTLLPEISAFGANILFVVLALILIRLKRT